MFKHKIKKYYYYLYMNKDFNPDDINPSDLEKEIEKQRKLESEVKLLLNKNKNDKYSSIKGIIHDSNIQRHTQLGFYQTKIKELYNDVTALSSKNSELVKELTNTSIDAHNNNNENLLNIIKSLQEEKEKYKQHELTNITNNNKESERIKELQIKIRQLQLEVSKSVVKSVVEPVVEPVVKSVVEPVVKSVVEPVVEPVVKSVVKSVVEPVVKSVVEQPNTDLINKILLNESNNKSMPVSEPQVKTISEPQVKTISEPQVKTINKWKPRALPPPGYYMGMSSSQNKNKPPKIISTTPLENKPPKIISTTPLENTNKPPQNKLPQNKLPQNKSRKVISFI